MRLRTALATALLIFAAMSTGHAQDVCFRRPVPLENISDIRVTTLVLQTPRITYAINQSCMILRRDRFGGILKFALINRFPSDIGVRSGYVFIKSNRTLSNEPDLKLSLSRGSGWYLPGADQAPMVEMNYRPYKGTIEAWNTAHSSEGDPPDFSQRLNIQWHAYALKDLALPSTDITNFWKVDDSFDRQHGVMTNYLLRFDVNVGSKISTIPFEVFLQKEVRQIELRIMSNMESLSGQYKFIVQ